MDSSLRFGGQMDCAGEAHNGPCPYLPVFRVELRNGDRAYLCELHRRNSPFNLNEYERIVPMLFTREGE